MEARPNLNYAYYICFETVDGDWEAYYNPYTNKATAIKDAGEFISEDSIMSRIRKYSGKFRIEWVEDESEFDDPGDGIVVYKGVHRFR